MDTTLLAQNVQHFAQADGTPFTRQPLLDIVGDDGCALGALRILEGNLPKNINRHTQILFKHMQQIRQFQQMARTDNHVTIQQAPWHLQIVIECYETQTLHSI
jgi:hypothetical protein